MSTTHPVVWFEILGAESGPLQTFYRSLFGWKINSDTYGLVDAENGGIPGGVGTTPGRGSSGVTVYVQVDDLQAALDRAQDLGGATLVPPTELPDVALAVFRDPAGNQIGLVRR